MANSTNTSDSPLNSSLTIASANTTVLPVSYFVPKTPCGFREFMEHANKNVSAPFGEYIVRGVEGAFMVLFIIATLAVNLFLWMVVIRYVTLRTNENILLLSLSVSNVMVAGLTMPFIAKAMFMGRWTLSCTLCRLSGFALHLGTTSTTLCVCALSVHHCVHECWASRYHMLYGEGAVKAHVSVTWSVSFALVLLPIVPGWLELTYSHNKYICVLLNPQQPSAFHPYITFLVSLLSLLAVLTVLCCGLAFLSKRRRLAGTGGLHQARGSLLLMRSMLRTLHLGSKPQRDGDRSHPTSLEMLSARRADERLRQSSGPALDARVHRYRYRPYGPYGRSFIRSPSLSDIMEVASICSELEGSDVLGRRSSHGNGRLPSLEDSAVDLVGPLPKVTAGKDAVNVKAAQQESLPSQQGDAIHTETSVDSPAMSLGRVACHGCCCRSLLNWRSQLSRPKKDAPRQRKIGLSLDTPATREATLPLVVVLFIVTYAPSVIALFVERDTSLRVPPLLDVSFLLLLCANCMFGPVVYGWGSQHLRHGYKALLKELKLIS